jgi:hypothetical protein
VRGPALLVGVPAGADIRGPAAPALAGEGLVRVLVDRGEVLAAYRLHVRNAGPGREGELLYFAAADRARRCGGDLLLLKDLIALAGARGVGSVTLAVRPPWDVFFRTCGAEPVGIEVSCADPGAPLLRLTLSVPT